MDRKQQGFTLIEILVVVTIIGVLAGLVVVLIPRGREKANQTECTNNQRQLVSTLITLDDTKFPNEWGGVNLLLYLYKAKHIVIHEDNLGLLFCPGDEIQTLKDVSREDATQVYNEVDLDKAGDYGKLSSYAARNQTDQECRAIKSSTKPQAMIADDSEDHHLGKGFVVGYSNGSAKFKSKLDDWKMQDIETEVRVGQGSTIEDLKCLSSDD